MYDNAAQDDLCECKKCSVSVFSHASNEQVS